MSEVGESEVDDEDDSFDGIYGAPEVESMISSDYDPMDCPYIAEKFGGMEEFFWNIHDGSSESACVEKATKSTLSDLNCVSKSDLGGNVKTAKKKRKSKHKKKKAVKAAAVCDEVCENKLQMSGNDELPIGDACCGHICNEQSSPVVHTVKDGPVPEFYLFFGNRQCHPVASDGINSGVDAMSAAFGVCSMEDGAGNSISVHEGGRSSKSSRGKRGKKSVGNV